MMGRPAGGRWDGWTDRQTDRQTDRSKTDTRVGDIKVLRKFNQSGPVAAIEAGSVNRKYVFTMLARQSSDAKSCAIITAPFTIMHTVNRHNCSEE
jgi:hypothetical protein